MGKSRLILTSVLSFLTVVGGVAILANSTIDKSYVALDSHANAVTNQITFDRESCDMFSRDDNKKQYITKTHTINENTIFMDCRSGIGLVSGYSTTSIGSFKSSMDNTDNTFLRFYKNYTDDTLSGTFAFQKLTSLTVVTSRVLTMTIYTSPDDVHYFKKGTFETSEFGGTYTSFSNIDRFMYLTVNKEDSAIQTTALLSVSISYSCENNVVYSFNSGVSYFANYKNRYDVDVSGRIVFNNDNTGVYTYYGTTTDETYYNFTWLFDSAYSILKINYATGSKGNNAAYQGCRLLNYNATNNPTWFGVFETCIAVPLFTDSAGKVGTLDYMWTSPVLFNLETNNI